MKLPKGQRIELLFERLKSTDLAGDHDEALALITRTQHEVEDEFSGVPYNPEEPGTDGRMYPPHERFRYTKWEQPGVQCYRQVAHATFIAANGAIEIRKRHGNDLGNIIFEKPGKDGRKVREYDSS